MSEENMQCENCEQNNCECEHQVSVIGYDICALVFCFYPLLVTIFGIDYHNANNIVQTGGKMFLFAMLPLAISIISLKNANKVKTVSHITFSSVFVLMLVYFVILLFGFLEGGKLF